MRGARVAGDGWCAYSDITAAVRRVRAATGGRVQRVAVIDTDVHQGNGPARDKLHFRDGDLAIVDLYNAGAPPGHTAAWPSSTAPARTALLHMHVLPHCTMKNRFGEQALRMGTACCCLLAAVAHAAAHMQPQRTTRVEHTRIVPSAALSHV